MPEDAQDRAGDESPSPFARLFVAVEICEVPRAKLAEVQARLKRSGAHVAWVPPANFHFSLAFLGNVARDGVPELVSRLDLAVLGLAPFEIAMRGVGGFGGPRAPKVIWAGCGPSPAFQALHAAVAASLDEAGFRPDPRPFRPHLTLGRVKSGRNREALLSALEAVRDAEFGQGPVAHVALMESRLRPQGAEYRRLHAAALG